MEQEVQEKFQNVYSFITRNEESWRTERVPLASNWRDWNMYEHIDRSFQLKNSRFYKGNQDYTRPFNNIILPIANVSYRTEGFDVKDTELYVDNQEQYHKSFLARKFHDWWAKEKKIDQAIDGSVESYYDYGLVLMKNVNEAKPEVVPLQQIAFCDQTDIMSGPICLKHNYTIDQLQEMEGKWDSDAIRKTVLMAKTGKKVDQADDDSVETPGKYIEIYELHGMLPESWLGEEKLGEDWVDTGKYSPQIHIVSFYVSPIDNKSKNGITLFKGKEPKPIFKALMRDPIFGRACGRGGIEELFHPQIWTNLYELNIQRMLDAVSKVVMITTDKKLRGQNFASMNNGQVIHKEQGTEFAQLPIQPINKVAFDNAVNKWEQVARTIGSASDPQLGLNPVSGTPLGTTEIVTSQGVGIHDYRRGKIADFWAEIYRDWVLPHLQKEINQGHKWLDELSLDELEEVADRVVTVESNKRLKNMVLNGQIPTQDSAELIKSLVRESFMKGGTKRFLEIVRDDFKDLPMDIKINVANKQEDIPAMISKLNSVFRTLFTPGVIQTIQQNQGLASLLNEILEKSGLSPINFAKITTATPINTQLPELQAVNQ